jgi:tetraacyldisaccharide 4'-kinase
MSRSNDNWVQKIWYGGSPLRWLLLPFTWLYAAIIACRRSVYASGLLRSQRVSAPVLIVGNIAVGGTGKTPLTIWLAQQLAARDYKPGIISRGYRGMVGPKPMQATAASDPAVVGDEAILLANRSECPVVVHPDRIAAAKLAIELGANVIVSDDGLQHYRLGRDFEIVVVDGARQHGNGQLLPAGPLREPVSRLQTCDQILVQRESDDGPELTHHASDHPSIEFRLTASAICRPDNSDIRNIGDFSGTTVHAIAGIGNPERFFRMLEAHDIDVIRHPLADHADISPGDLDFGDDLDVVMTEKDAVKCRALDPSSCWYVPVDVAIDDADAEELLDRILQKISPVEKVENTHG